MIKKKAQILPQVKNFVEIVWFFIKAQPHLQRKMSGELNKNNKI